MSSRIRLIASAVTLFLAIVAPWSARADVLYGTASAGGYTFTNFDPTLQGAALGSNANGISNTGQVVGFTVSLGNVALGKLFRHAWEHDGLFQPSRSDGFRDQ